MLREDSDDEDNSMPHDARDPFTRAAGRGSGSTSKKEPDPPRSFGKVPPFTGKELVGHCCMMTYPTGAKQELRWHNAWVAAAKEVGAGPAIEYEIYIPFDRDFEDVLYSPNEAKVGQEGVCFLNIGSAAAQPRWWSQEIQAEVAAARRVRHRDGPADADDESAAGAPRGKGKARA